MERAKRFVERHFEIVIVVVLVLGIAFAVLLAGNKLAFLNFFYVPVLIAAYFLGRKQGVLAAAATVMMVAFYGIINPRIFDPQPGDNALLNLALWGCFTVLTAFVVGTLYDLKSRSARELRQAYEGILEILAKYIDAVDKYTRDHSVRVANLAVRIGEAMMLPHEDLEDLWAGGLLHDIGKIDISLDVLRKASRLDADEWKQVREHTKKGSQLLSPVGGLLRNVVPLVEFHHESFDGSGYAGLKGDEIPLGARILAVADSYDSMISDRPYRSGRTPAEAHAELQRCSGSQFDPRIVDAFKNVMSLEESDSMVMHHRMPTRSASSA